MQLFLLLILATPTLQEKLLAECGSTTTVYRDTVIDLSTHQMPRPTTPPPTQQQLLWKPSSDGWSWKPLPKANDADNEIFSSSHSTSASAAPILHLNDDAPHVWNLQGERQLPPLYSIFLRKERQMQSSRQTQMRKYPVIQHPDLFDLFERGSQRIRRRREVGQKRHCTYRFKAGHSCPRLLFHITQGDTSRMFCMEEYLTLVDIKDSKTYCGRSRLQKTTLHEQSLEATYVGRGETLLEGYVTCGQ